MKTDWFWFLMGALAVWRVTHLLHAEDGPWQLIVRLRCVAGTGFWAELLDCFYCLSLWIAAPVAVLLGASWKERLLIWPALSAAAILLERVTTRQPPAPPPYIEEQENSHVLRSQ
jgi:hypothetical protein